MFDMLETLNKPPRLPCKSSSMKAALIRFGCSTVEEYLQKLGDKVDLVYVEGFIRHGKSCTWRCKNNPDHPAFQIPPAGIAQHNQRCPYCHGKYNDMKYVIYRAGCATIEEYLNKVGEQTGLVYVDGYCGTMRKANWRCKKDPTHPVVALRPNDVLCNNTGCAYCNGSDMKYVLFRNNCKTLDGYGHKIALENPNDIKYVGGFVSDSQKAEWECNRMGHRWKSTPHCVKAGNGCPACATFVSKKETALFKEIQKIYPDATDRNRKLLKNTSYELDIYVPSLKKAVEFDGDYWHSLPVAIRRDAEKDVQCVEAGIKLMRVKESDWDTDKDTVIKNVLEFLKG